MLIAVLGLSPVIIHTLIPHARRYFRSAFSLIAYADRRLHVVLKQVFDPGNAQREKRALDRVVTTSHAFHDSTIRS